MSLKPEEMQPVTGALQKSPVAQPDHSLVSLAAYLDR